MSVGIHLSDEDLEAIRRLYKVRWYADIRSWKERDTDYCMWVVTCPDMTNQHITETGQALANTISRILERALNKGV